MLTKVWLIGATLELDSSGTCLYQEVPHQLMGHVSWKGKEETELVTHCHSTPPQHCLIASAVYRVRWERRVLRQGGQSPVDEDHHSLLCVE